jgi:hypothetical protein
MGTSRIRAMSLYLILLRRRAGVHHGVAAEAARARCVDGGSVIEAEEDVFGGGAGGGSVEGGGMVFEKDSAGGGDAGRGGEEGVAENAEDPGLEVGVGLKGVKGAEGFGEGLLDEVFGVGWIAGEPEGVVVERGEERERELLKSLPCG